MPMVVYTEEECIEAHKDGEREGLERGQQERERLIAENVKLRAVVDAARNMPLTVPGGGGVSTLHTFQISAGTVWQLDRAITNLDAP